MSRSSRAGLVVLGVLSLGDCAAVLIIGTLVGSVLTLSGIRRLVPTDAR